MKLFTDPVPRAWRLADRPAPAKAQVLSRLSAEPRALIATGHQAWLWHPGILAKDLAAASAARRFHGSWLHLLVDHDPHPPLRVELPVVSGRALSFETVDLVPVDPAVPPCCLPPFSRGAVLDALRTVQKRLGGLLAADLSTLFAALEAMPEAAQCRSAAEQVAAVLDRLVSPWTGPRAVFAASEVLRLPAGGQFVQRVLDDAARCASCYNAAVLRRPEANMTTLRTEATRTELPLWHLAPGQPRRRVFAARSRGQTVLATEDGRVLDEGNRWLAPRALALTALLRSAFCELFIHGKGGGVYDQAMQQWWGDWTGQDLAPRVVVSADAHLRFPPQVPVSDQEQLARAVWWRHHLPHNLDRALQLASPGAGAGAQDQVLARRKAELLAHMDDDHDRRRRAAAFAELHAINQALARAHPQALTEAQERLERARLGVANQAVAVKRDWCLGLYPPADLDELRRAIEAAW